MRRRSRVRTRRLRSKVTLWIKIISYLVVRPAHAAAQKLGAALWCGTSYPASYLHWKIAPNGSEVLVAATGRKIAEQLKYTPVAQRRLAAAVGKAVAERAYWKKASKDIDRFDRSGFPICGRVEALADAARESWLQF